MNLPNSLTILRIFFVPLLVVVLLTREPNFDFWGMSIHFEVWGVMILLAGRGHRCGGRISCAEARRNHDAGNSARSDCG